MNERRALPCFLAVSLLFAAGAARADETAEPLTLARAMALAAERAPVVAHASAGARASAAEEASARAAFGPSANLTSTPGYSIGFPVAVVGRAPAILGVEAHQTLWDQQRRADALEAGASRARGGAGLERARRDAARDAAVAYARCTFAAARTSAALARLAAEEEAARRTTLRSLEERETDLSAARASLRVSRARQRLLEAETDRDLAALDLNRLLGRSPESPIALAEDPLAVLPGSGPGPSLEEAAAADPDRKGLEVRLANLEKAASLRDRWFQPVVEAGLQYNLVTKYNNYDEYYSKYSQNNFTVGLTIAVPLLSGGRLRAAAERTRATADELRFERAVADSDLAMEVRRAEAAVSAAAAAEALARQALGIADEAVRIARLFADEGRGGADGVPRAEADRADTLEEAARARFDLAAARATLLSLTGRLLPSAGILSGGRGI